MLHMGTLLALILYFWRDWLTLIPAGLASIRDRSFGDDLDRKMAWLLVVATIPAVLVGPLLTDTIESLVREPARSRRCSASAPRSCGLPTDGAARSARWTC